MTIVRRPGGTVRGAGRGAGGSDFSDFDLGTDANSITVSVTALSNAVEGGALGAFRFSRTGPTGMYLSMSYTVQTGSGAATPGADYGVLSWSVTIPEHQEFVDVTVEAFDDATIEAPETVTVALTSGTGIYVPDENADEATVTITDAPLVVSVAPLSHVGEGRTAAAFRFSLNRAVSTALTIPYSVATTGSNPATAGDDYVAPVGSVTIPAWATHADVSLTALPDALVEDPESVTLTVEPTGVYTVGAGAASVDVLDRTPVVSVARIDDAVEGVTPGRLRFTRTGDAEDELTVAYQVQTVGPGYATPDEDYAALSGTVTFAPGSATADVWVTAYQDGTEEVPETVEVLPLAGDDYAVESGTAQVWIWDDPSLLPPEVTVTGIADAFEGGPAGILRFARTGSTDDPLTVTYSLLAGADEATPGDDYTALSGAVTFPIGAWDVDVAVTAADDEDDEPTQYVTAKLLTGLDYEVGDPDTGRVKIADDDTHVGKIGGKVWDDTDKDGIMEAGEPGRADQYVELLDVDGKTLFTTKTGADGSYAFVGLAEDKYAVKFSEPVLEKFAPKDQGADDETDSDADVATGMADLVALSSGAMSQLFVSAGLFLMQQPIAPTGVRIQITDRYAVESKTLRVAKWQDAFELTADGGGVKIRRPDAKNNWDFIDRDPDRFNIWVYDLNQWGKNVEHIEARVSTENVAGFTEYNDGATPVDLVRYTGPARGPGWYWSDSQMLVSNEVDDKYSALPYLAYDDVAPYPYRVIKNDAAWKMSDRTHRVALRGTVTVAYKTDAGATVTSDANVPAAKTVKVHAMILRDKKAVDGGTEVITKADADTKLHQANEQYAQVGILLLPDSVVVDPPNAGVNLGDGLDMRPTPNWLDANKKSIIMPETAALTVPVLHSPGLDDIELYFINNFKPDQKWGEAYPAGVAPAARFEDLVIMTKDANSIMLAHEIGHILLDSAPPETHYVGPLQFANLLCKGGEHLDSVTAIKRLVPAQQIEMLSKRVNLLTDP